MRFSGRECERAPYQCSHRCEFMGYIWPGYGAAKRATSIINNGSHLAMLVHQGSDPTPPYQALVIRQSATLQAKASRATGPQGVVSAPRPVRSREVIRPLQTQFYSSHPQLGQDYGQNLSQPTRPALLSAGTRLQLTEFRAGWPQGIAPLGLP